MAEKPTDTAAITQQILSGGRAASILRAVGQVISWVSTIVVVRYLMPEDYGLFSMVEAPLELLLMLGVLGLETALVRAKAIDHDALRASFGVLLVVSIACASVMFFSAPVLAAHFGQPGVEPLARALSVVFLLTPFRVIPNALLDRDLLFKSRAQLELVSKVAFAATTLGLAVAGFGVWALAVGFIVDRCLYAVLVMIRHPWFIWPSLALTKAVPLLAFGGITVVSSAVVLLTGKGAIVIAAPILGAEALGVYVLATELARMPVAKVMPVINPLLIPAFARFRDNPSLAANHLERALLVVGSVVIPFSVGLACLAEPFVVGLFGERWREAALPVALLSIVTPARMVSLMSRAVITTFDRPDLTLATNVITLAIVVPGSLVAVRYGPLGLVALWLIADPVSEMVAKSFLGRLLPWDWQALARALIAPVSSCAIMALALAAVRALVSFSSPLLELSVCVALGAVAYMLAFRLVFADRMKFVVSVLFGK